MAMKAPFSASRKYSKYKVSNNREYNDILRSRGRLDLMISSDLAEGWYEDKKVVHNGSGRPNQYSDKAILVSMEIRFLFRLPLRQTQGFINYLFEIFGFDIKCPDYSTLSRRSKSLKVKKRDYSDKEFEYISVDSTGVATYTGNEWLENKHGNKYKRKTWQKLHIGVDGAGDIDLTRSPAPDGSAASLAATREEASPASSPAAPGGSDDSDSEKKPKSTEIGAVEDVLNPDGGGDGKKGRAADGEISGEEPKEGITGMSLSVAAKKAQRDAAGSTCSTADTNAEQAIENAVVADSIADRSGGDAKPIVAPNPVEEEEVDKVQAANRALIDEEAAKMGAGAGAEHSFGETAMRSVDGKPKIEQLDPHLTGKVNAVSGGLQSPPKVEALAPAAAPALTQEQAQGQEAKAASPAADGMARPSTPPPSPPSPDARRRGSGQDKGQRTVDRDGF